ncbi:ketoacyl-ACP synthase III [Vibrio sp. T20]|uniref:ketoacyl-ACP synthase III n=1 Tax=Vibrio sp. T20 TaxID=2588450 RepID=UPI0011B4682A|nr:ketoacyl-ACP synthase III [Vibrio sp. T20]
MLTINDVSIAGVAATVPPKKINNSDLSAIYGEKETSKLISSVGVKQRYIADDGITSSDLCLDAAINLLGNTGLSVNNIQALIFVSQTSDYQLPATACILQHKLGLPNNTISFDINLGCSGYVYGLQVASSLINSGINNVLLLVGDTISKIVQSGDRSTELLFGDAGTATLLQKKIGEQLHFDLGSDGSGFQHIIAKTPIESDSNDMRGKHYSHLEMDGGEVFAFTLKRVPKLVNNFLKELSVKPEDVDICVYHQANHFMLKHLSKKSKFTAEQMPISIDQYGNTSSASIPVTLCSTSSESYVKTLFVGFGVGLSWGAVFCDLSQTLILPIRELVNGE